MTFKDLKNIVLEGCAKQWLDPTDLLKMLLSKKIGELKTLGLQHKDSKLLEVLDCKNNCIDILKRLAVGASSLPGPETIDFAWLRTRFEGTSIDEDIQFHGRGHAGVRGRRR